MDALLENAAIAAPLFSLVLFGYAAGRWGSWPAEMWQGLTRFVFSVALPALLFRQMAGLSDLPPVDAKLLIAFFGGCLVVFVAGRLLAWRVFGLGGVEQSLFAMGGVFSNNVMLGVPLVTAALGSEALPSVALVLVFNALFLWTLVTVSVEWAREGSMSPRALAAMGRNVLTNPVVAGILAGTALGLTGLPIPVLLDEPLRLISAAAVPLALIALGAGLVGHRVRQGWRISAGISTLKLVVQPAVVWLLALALGLPALETQVVTLLASLSVGANVYLMSHRFRALEGPIAASLVLSTGLSVVSTPLVLTLVSA